MGQSGSREDNLNEGGGGAGDDVKRQVDSDLDHLKPIYQLVNVKTGGGKLIELIKQRAKDSSGSFAIGKSLEATTATTNSASIQQQIEHSFDMKIRQLVEPLLYNCGRGKLVPLAEIWCHRFNRSAAATTTTTTRHSAHNDDNDELDKANQESGAASVKQQQQACYHQPQNQPIDINGKMYSSKYRWVCWKLEERGFVGETALHICFLLSTQTHMILAQKLLKLFPMLINDIYTCDEYFGESSLHMAIVNENVRIVKLLLNHGANVHERCLGSFFLPNDLKDKANGSIKRMLFGQRVAAAAASANHDYDNPRNNNNRQKLDLESNQFSSSNTDYLGYTYWGEYPLSFAISLGLIDCYKLLLAKGADPNRQDSVGNSTLHIAVIANRIDMFNLSYKNGADLNLTNRLNLDPLKLAAKLKRVEMFFHILTIKRQVNWIFCQVAFVDTPLDGIDSINTIDGSCDDNSVLSIVVAGDSNEHLQMLDGLVSELLHVKWNTSTRKKLQIWLYTYLIFLAVSFVAYITRFRNATNPPTTKTNQIQMYKNVTTSISSSLLTYYHHYFDLQLIQSASECLMLVYIVYYLWIILSRVAPKPGNAIAGQPTQQQLSGRASQLIGRLEALAQAPELLLFGLTCLLILACIPLRFLGLTRSENTLVAVIMFLLPIKLLFFCRSSRSLGPHILMIFKILATDVLCFFIYSLIFIFGFSQSFLIIFNSHKSNVKQLPTDNTGETTSSNFFNNSVDVVISLLMMAFNEFTSFVGEFDSTSYPILARQLFCIYVILVAILLINMFIAMLGKTYQDISSQPNENLRQWARALLRVERFLSNSTRLRMLDNYSYEKFTPTTGDDVPLGGLGELLANKQQQQQQQKIKSRCYSSTWGLSEKDSIEIKLVKKLNQDNKLNAHRLANRQKATSAA